MKIALCTTSTNHMKKKYTITALLLFFIFSCGYSQKFGIGLQTGIGTYRMSGLEDLNTYVIRNMPFDTRLVSDFPAYWYYRPSISFKFDQFSIGLLSTFQSTGSRVSAKDYSGEYRFDLKVKSHNPGIYAEVELFDKNNLHLTLSYIAGLSFSKLTMEEHSIILDQQQVNDKYKFKALNYFVEPGLNFYYQFYFLTLGINAGYFFQIGKQEYYTNDNKNAKLANPQANAPIKPDWNGFRVGASVRYSF